MNKITVQQMLLKTKSGFDKVRQSDRLYVIGSPLHYYIV